MDYIIILAVIGTFAYLLFRKHKKKPAGKELPGTGTETRAGRDAELLEVLEILVAKLEILILRKKEKEDGAEGSP